MLQLIGGLLRSLFAPNPSRAKTHSSLNQHLNDPSLSEWERNFLTHYTQGNYTKAIEVLRPLANAGNYTAQFALGEMYRNGHGVEQSYKYAVYWYKKAAEQGHIFSQAYLGASYATGDGIEQDLVKAYMWASLSLTLAAKRSEAPQPEAAQMLRGLNAHMHPSQVVEAEKQALDWWMIHIA